MPAPNYETRDFIKSNWDKMDNQQLADALNIPLYQVYNYARRMKLRRTEPKPVYTDEQRKQARKEALQRYREKQAAQGFKPKQYYKPKTETMNHKPKNTTYVASQYGKMPTKQIATNLSISVGAVRLIAHKLGIAKRVTPKVTTKTVQNNVPTEKVSKLSTSENPAKFKIRDPYRPNDPNVRYEPRIDPNNGRLMYVERRVS